jgi:type VI secretion system protein ImpA
MAVLDVETLLAPISAEAPCGENLEYDPAYVALEGLVRGKPEQQVGDKIIPAEEPDWREADSRDLRRCAVLSTSAREATIRSPSTA